MINIEKMLTGTIRRVSHVNRYSTHLCRRYENVAEHMYYTSVYSLFLSEYLISKGLKVDKNRLLSSALLHDCSESITGDMLRLVKHSRKDLERIMDSLECASAHNILYSIVSGNYTSDGDRSIVNLLSEYYKNAKNDTIEGHILALSDVLSVIAYAMEEVKGGNKHMLDVLYEISSYVCNIPQLINCNEHLKDIAAITAKITDNFISQYEN